jgi:hypothetical protein
VPTTSCAARFIATKSVRSGAKGETAEPDGSNLTPDLSAVESGLPSTDLPQGQKVYDPIAVDVPLGKAIAQIVLTNGLGGAQLGLWFS